MSGLEKLMKRHCESENRYLEQLPLRKDIQQVNDAMHYVWFIQTRHRTSHTAKLPTTRSRPSNTNSESLVASCSVQGNLTPDLKKYSEKISKKTNRTSSLKLSKRQKQAPNKSVILPHLPLPDNSSRPSLSLPNTSTSLTTSFEDTFNRIQNYPLPPPDCISSELYQPEIGTDSCYDPYKDIPVEFGTYESMVEWNNLNF